MPLNQRWQADPNHKLSGSKGKIASMPLNQRWQADQPIPVGKTNKGASLDAFEPTLAG
jgi:hypothetical protein